MSETLNHLLVGNTHKNKHFKGKLNAVPGFISTLHTWGRSLNLHPHIHVLITSGGLNKHGKWIGIDNDFLLPVRQVKSLYRGKFQDRIKTFILSHDVRLPPRQTKYSLLKIQRDLYQKKWSVRIQEKYSHGKGVLIYLSRYLGSNPVKPEQIKQINRGKEVLFSYWSHRDKKQKRQRLNLQEFLKKYLLHQAEPLIHTIRYYGLYGSQAKSKRNTCIDLLGETDYQKEKIPEDTTTINNGLLCSCCGAIMKLSHVSTQRWKLKNPLYSRVFQNRPLLVGIIAPIPSG